MVSPDLATSTVTVVSINWCDYWLENINMDSNRTYMFQGAIIAKLKVTWFKPAVSGLFTLHMDRLYPCQNGRIQYLNLRTWQ